MLAEVDEPHRTFIENAIVKARHACEQTGLPSLADDSGICVNALNGQPGVLSARYAGEPKSDERNNLKLIDVLSSQADRRAHYYCVMVLMRHRGRPSAHYCGWQPGTVKSCVISAARVDSVTILIFICRTSAKPQRNFRWSRKIKSAIEDKALARLVSRHHGRTLIER